jgi:hypothetical protein
MKTRTGFVSNSSSTSFVFPAEFSREQVENLMKHAIAAHNIIQKDDALVPEDLYTLETFGEFLARGREFAEEDFKATDRKTHPDSCLVVSDVRDNGIPYWMHELFEENAEVIARR